MACVQLTIHQERVPNRKSYQSIPELLEWTCCEYAEHTDAVAAYETHKQLQWLPFENCISILYQNMYDTAPQGLHAIQKRAD